MTSVDDITVAIYSTHAEAEKAVMELQKSGFDMKKLSIIGKNPHAEEHVVGFYTTGDRITFWGAQGAFWGTVWGMLMGAAFFAVPGLGPILVAGPVVALVVGALEGAVTLGGLSAIGASLYSIGIPKDSVIAYEIAVKTDQFILLAHGNTAEAARARDVLQTTLPDELHSHSLTGVAGIREHEPVVV